MLFKNPPQFPDLNSPDEITITPKKKIKTLRQKFFFIPPKSDMENTIKFEYKPK